MGWTQEKNKRREMYALTLPSPVSRIGDWALSLEDWSRNLHQYPISGIMDKIVELFLKKERKDKDREAGGSSL